MTESGGTMLQYVCDTLGIENQRNRYAYQHIAVKGALDSNNFGGPSLPSGPPAATRDHDPPRNP